ncbi:hypothetical protein ACKI1O_53185, partial [Streptomyces scabiei]
TPFSTRNLTEQPIDPQEVIFSNSGNQGRRHLPDDSHATKAPVPNISSPVDSPKHHTPIPLINFSRRIS